MQETLVQFLGREDPLEKGTATHSSILAWRIPWTIKSQTQLSDFHFHPIFMKTLLPLPTNLQPLLHNSLSLQNQELSRLTISNSLLSIPTSTDTSLTSHPSPINFFWWGGAGRISRDCVSVALLSPMDIFQSSSVQLFSSFQYLLNIPSIKKQSFCLEFKRRI